MSDHVEELVDLYAQAKSLHERLYNASKDFVDRQRDNYNEASIADTILTSRKIGEYLKDAAKELDRSSALLSKIGGYMKAQTLDDKSFKGELATGYLKIEHLVRIPSFKTHPAECRTIMNALGVPEALFEHGAVRPHWPAMVELISDKINSGLPLPEGIDGKKTYPKYSVIARAKSGVSLDALAADRKNDE